MKNIIMKSKNAWINKTTVLTVCCAAFFIAIAGVIYIPALTGDFQFDDYPFIVKNYLIRDVTRLDLIAQCLDQPSRFAVFYTFALNYHWWGLNAFAFHLTNWLLHVLTGWVVYRLSLALLQSPGLQPAYSRRDAFGISLSVALLFLFHPVQTQAVSYISQRFSLMATLFYLSTILFFVKARQVEAVNLKKAGYFCAAGLTALLGLFSKEVVITLPIMLGVVGYYFLRPQQGVKIPLTFQKKHVLYAVTFIAALAVVPALFSFKFSGVLFGPKHSGSHEGELITLGPYVLTQFRVWVRFFQLLFWPARLTFDYDFPLSRHLLEAQTLGSLVVLVLLAGMAVRLRKSRPVLSFGLVWFFVTLLPNLIPRSHVIFEHKLYLVSFGVFLAVMAGLFELLRAPRIRLAVIVFVLSLFCLLTYQRNLVWHDQVSFWQDAVQKAPRKSRPYMNLGGALVKAGQLDEAQYFLDKALAIDPELWEVWNNKGLIATEQGRYSAAAGHFERALALKPDYEEIVNNRGLMHYRQGEYDSALRDFFRATEINPAFEQPYYHIGRIYFTRSDYAKAQQYYEKALDLFPDFYKAYNGLGLVYTQAGQYEQAEQSFRQALAIKADVAEIYSNLGYLSYQQRQFDEALEYFNIALDLNPRFYKAYNNRGNVYQLQKKYDQALQDYSRTLSLQPEYAQAYSNRGVTYRTLGRLELALKDLDQAVRIAGQTPEFHHNRANILKDLDRGAEAVQAYSQAIALKPDYIQARINRALMYKRRRAYESALEDLKTVIALDPQNITAYINRGNIFAMSSRYEAALADYSKAIAIDPDAAAAYHNRILAYTKIKDYTKALADCQTLIDQQPLSAQLFYQRAQIYALLQQRNKALQDARRAQELGADIPQEFFTQVQQSGRAQ
jgi:tetratricopeptide (TPR) repeat protein